MVKSSKIRLKNKADNILEKIAEQTDFGTQEYDVQNAQRVFHAAQYAFGPDLDVKKPKLWVIFTQNTHS